MISKKALLGLAAAAALLGGCATSPYYDGYAYDDGYYYDRPVVRYYDYDGYGRYAYPRYYAGPSVGLSLSFSNRHRHRYGR